MKKVRKEADALNGESFPIGPKMRNGGVNFSLYSKNGERVDLLFFDDKEDVEPSRTIQLDPIRNKTYHYWHVFVPGIKPGQLYGYQISGPHDHQQGHRFDSDKVLLDPYAKAVAVPAKYNRAALSEAGKPNSPAMKSVVCDLSLYDWQNDQHPKHPFAQTIIYEMHVGGFTKSPTSNVSAEKRGTFAGLIEKIPYLVDLGVTAVELLPVFQFDRQDCPEGLVNYWGYSPVSFFAPHQEYGTGGDPLKVLDEFRDMVKAFHRSGIEVLLDVVYNHTAEGGDSGPTFCFKGIDNSTYYTLESDSGGYANFSGTGNTLSANNSPVRRMIIDSLHFWVTQMHVDGFRFDLASILSRDERGTPIENPPVLWDIESDPVFAGTKLIAEAWDAAGLYQVGSFVGDSWKEWNGKFRDDIRGFLKGDHGSVSKLATRMVGSPDLFEHENREPEQSINFVTCHDGFTMNDLVSYNVKHNEANGEQNRDGSNDNNSWNFGFEGPAADPHVEALRNRQVKNFFALTFLSVGTPMILMGDEVRRTQNGNNNAYCQDSDLSWFDWNLLEKHKDLFRFVKQMIDERLQRDMSHQEFGMSLRELLSHPLVTWHGIKLNQPDWSENSHTLAFTVQSLSGSRAIHCMVNSYTERLDFEIPLSGNERPFKWKRWIDTSLPSPHDICLWNALDAWEGFTYSVEPHALAVFITELEGLDS